MKIVVDSNIVFSAILNTRSNIGQIITVGNRYFDFYTTSLLKTEILNHRTKIQKITDFSDNDFSEIYELVISKMRFFNEILIPNNTIQEALKLTSDIDSDDTLFVALASHINAMLWTGDRQLEKGLNKKGYSQIINTRDLYEIFIQKEFKKHKK